MLSTEIPSGKARFSLAWLLVPVILPSYVYFQYHSFWGAIFLFIGIAFLMLKVYLKARQRAIDEELIWFANRTMPIFIVTEYEGEDIHPVAEYCRQMLRDTDNEQPHAKVYEFHFQLRPNSARETWEEFKVAAIEFMKTLDREAQNNQYQASPDAYTHYYYNKDKTSIINKKHENNN